MLTTIAPLSLSRHPIKRSPMLLVLSALTLTTVLGGCETGKSPLNDYDHLALMRDNLKAPNYAVTPEYLVAVANLDAQLFPPVDQGVMPPTLSVPPAPGVSRTGSPAYRDAMARNSGWLLASLPAKRGDAKRISTDTLLRVGILSPDDQQSLRPLVP